MSEIEPYTFKHLQDDKIEQDWKLIHIVSDTNGPCWTITQHMQTGLFMITQRSSVVFMGKEEETASYWDNVIRPNIMQTNGSRHRLVRNYVRMHLTRKALEYGLELSPTPVDDLSDFFEDIAKYR